jgi:hypothetical protein
MHLRRFLSDGEIKDFKNEHGIKNSSELSVQPFSEAINIINVNGNEYSLSNLEPYSVLAPDATATIDGSDDVVPANTLSDDIINSSLWSGRVGGADIVVVKDDVGSIEMITVREFDGKETNLYSLRLDDELTSLSGEDTTLLVTTSSDDYDFDEINGMYHYGESNRMWEGEDDDTLGSNITLPPTSNVTGVNNIFEDEDSLITLQQCNSYATVDLAIAFESSFCKAFNGNQQSATRKVVQVIGLASRKFFQNSNLCMKLSITHIEANCNSNNDPYRRMRLNDSGCNGRPGLLDDVTNLWNAQRKSITRDAMHLFSGTGYRGGEIGCAWNKALCRNAYGVNHVTFRNDLNLQAVLFSHEFGHNLGAQHLGYPSGHIMNTPINSGSNGFHANSKNQIWNYIDSRPNCP